MESSSLPTNEVCEGYVFTGVCHSVHRGGMCGCWGACMVARGHVWLLQGGMHGCSWGACVVALGGVHGCSGGHAWLLPGGCVWLLQGACMVAPRGVRGCSGGACMVLRGACVVAPRGGLVAWGGMCGFFDEIRSMSGRYTSYWNAFLFPFAFTINLPPLSQCAGGTHPTGMHSCL